MSERTPLPYATPMDLWRAFKGGAKFVLHYHGKTFDVTHMEPRERVVYVQPPGFPVKVLPNGASAEGTCPDIWLAAADGVTPCQKCHGAGANPDFPLANCECWPTGNAGVMATPAPLLTEEDWQAAADAADFIITGRLKEAVEDRIRLRLAHGVTRLDGQTK